MPTGHQINSAQIALRYVEPVMRGYMAEALESNPELAYFPRFPIRGTSYKTRKLIGRPTSAFRRYEDGVKATEGAKWDMVRVATALMVDELFYDNDLKDEFPTIAEGEGTLRAEEIQLKIEAQQTKIAKAFWEGRVEDPDGFDGVKNLLQLRSSANGTAAGNHSSIYCLRRSTSARDKRGVHLLAGIGQYAHLKYRQWRIRQETGPNGRKYDVEYNAVKNRPGLQLHWKYAGFRLSEVTDQDGDAAPNDDMLFEAIQQHFKGTNIKPAQMGYSIWMSTRTLEALRQTRDTNNGTRISLSPSGTPAVNPDQIAGMPIFTSDNIRDDEA